MRKVIFKINDLEWMRKFYKLTEESAKDIFKNQESLKVIYTLIGNDKKVDRYELTDYDGNKIDYNSLNGYERGVVLNDCYAYFIGGKYHYTNEPCGVIEIVEEVV